MKPRPRDEGTIGKLVNVGGVALATALLAGSLVRLRWVPVPETPIVHDPQLQLEHVFRFDPVAWASVGCLLLTATPTLRVLFLGIGFLVQKRMAFALAAIGVLLVLVGGIVAGSLLQ